ncbi:MULTISPECIES: hypothetical protein [unclassified Acinetobacter]|uniref:hypothetical protein n=1 Tax=unclassified Acinetobacter TaxID=196816 RepID=UPI0035BABE27
MQESEQKIKEKALKALEEKAKSMPKHDLTVRVQQKIRAHQAQKYERWGIRLAIAAAIAGLSTIPFLVSNQAEQQQAVDTTRLSPQFAEDLEMLKVLGKDMPNVQ